MLTSLFLRALRSVLPTLLALLLASAAQAQFVPDGATKIFTGATNLAADLTVGNTGPNTTLIITNGGSVTANNGYTGESSQASSNNVIAVLGTGSKLTIPGGGSVLRTGNDSAFNSLLIEGGGFVSDGYGVIGFPAFATNNVAFITNSGSVWSNSVLFIGEHGSGNSLTVSGGGLALATAAGTIGVDSDASNNTAVVTGAGSLWKVSGQLNVGDLGAGSLLRIAAAGTVAATAMELGNQPGSVSNRLEVLGGNLFVTNASSNAVLEAHAGTVDFEGGVITADELLLTNTAGTVLFNDGTLITRSAIIKNSQAFVVGANPGADPSGTVFANTSLITIPATGTIGVANPYPSIIRISSLAGTITKVTVTVSNFVHSAPSDVEMALVSPDGSVVMLIASSGGTTPVSGVNLTFDDAAGSFPPTPLSSGTYNPTDFHGGSLPAPAPPGSAYSTALATFAGQNPNGAWLLYVNDAVSGNSGHLGAWSLKITTTTPAATWDVRSNAFLFTTVVGDLDIGVNGNNAALLVTNGAFVTINNSLNLGVNPGSYGNAAVIGAGHVVSDANVQVGAGGTFDTLVVTNGGSLTTIGSSTIGVGDLFDSTEGDNNMAVVTGPNSRWLNNGAITVGYNGSFNSMVVNNGGFVSSPGGTIGQGEGGSLSLGANNQVIVAGANSLWTNSSQLIVGANGPSSTLQVNNSGTVRANGAVIGVGSSITGAQLSVGGGALTVTNATANAVLNVLRGSLALNGGAITADQLLVSNGSSSVFSFTDGRLTTRAATISNGQDFLVGALAGTGAAGTAFTNGASISIPAPAFGTLGPGAPYPSVINVFNLAGSVVSVTVTVSNFNHTYPRDVDLALVNPDGVAVELMSFAGGGNPGVSGVTLTFDDASGNLPPTPLASGTYHPSSFRGESLPAPAPAGPYATNLAAFAGLTPNGAWSLYVNDAGQGDIGALANGWSLKIVTAPAAAWDVRSNSTPTTVANALDIGFGGPNAALLVTNGATLSVGLGADGTTSSVLGANPASSNNVAIIAGPNSLLANAGQLIVGSNSPLNTLLITNGGRITGAAVLIGGGSLANNNQAIVTGVNSLLTNNSFLDVGVGGSFNTLLISNGATVQATQAFVGLNSTSTGNLLTVAGGTLALSGGAGLLDVRRGQLIFNGGDITAAQLKVTNAQGAFTFNAGDLDVAMATVNNSLPFIVGDGSDAANYCMSSGGGLHTFANGITITNHAIITGAGVVGGALTIAPGGTLSPGEANIGAISLQNSPALQGGAFMEISKNGALRNNDLLQVLSHPLAYGGSLTVSNRGPSALALGDSFQLFAATGFSGVFSPVTLPALPAGLMWSNSLLTTGAITVVARTSPTISAAVATGANLSFNVTGGSPGAPWSLLTSADVALPLSSWTTIGADNFDWLGNVSLTNAISANETSRFFIVYAP